MKPSELFRKGFLCAAAGALCFAVFETATTPAPAQTSDQDEEVQMGQEVFNELKAKGEIVESSPLYDNLRPLPDPKSASTMSVPKDASEVFLR